jgi:hypothetical protein
MKSNDAAVIVFAIALLVLAALYLVYVNTPQTGGGP